MTDHMNAAVEAGAEGLSEFRVGSSGTSPGFLPLSDWQPEARAVIEAALPHIRAMIGAQIEAARERHDKIDREDALAKWWDGLDFGMQVAAQIARGERS